MRKPTKFPLLKFGPLDAKEFEQRPELRQPERDLIVVSPDDAEPLDRLLLQGMIDKHGRG